MKLHAEDAARVSTTDANGAAWVVDGDRFGVMSAA